ncbi:fumarylacetoacetate hydrolase family protein [Ramlibacter sp. G-1-2-2]|uniref:Fumarylacetoacetate hydrolase family protein n=1 Tax=Ramlibacter agri TaxID=2728837 RepID=A0A848GV76_9BURK|nr:fumarylacetoacetate hydrolase family protein [Ramlibacter agri]NML42254.1 fumarylacetoacetate hydrolase family protein [Ramlibacter agri]
MKLISFLQAGRPGFGAVIGDDGVVDLGRAFQGRYTELAQVLTDAGLAEVRAVLAGRAADQSLAQLELLPVIPRPGKIWCCGLNYAEHVAETQREVTEQPTFFLRVADSQAGHGQGLVCPRESTQFDYEAEIAVVIGEPGRRIAVADAARHIAGYACYNDGSIRDWQRHTPQWAPGKNFWRTGGFGPWLVTADEIPFGTVMKLRTRLNGQELQCATTDMMIHSIARQIAYVSTIAPLQTGDVIVTGTPGGVGARRNPPVWMKPGDVCEIEVDRIGVLRNPVVADD